jgi:hypothetical protein
VRVEVLGKLKNVIDLLGSRTRDLPACSIVPHVQELLSQEMYNCCQSKILIIRKSKMWDIGHTEA